MIFISCNQKKEIAASTKEEIAHKIESKNNITETETNSKVDTIVLDSKNNYNRADKILIHRTKILKSKQNGETIFYSIDFYKKSQKFFSHSYVSKNVYEGEEWSGYDEFFNDTIAKISDKRFINLSVGVPACGYGHINFLFFLGEKSIQLVCEYQSIGDGIYSNSDDFQPVFKGNKVVSFVRKNVSIDSDESKPFDEEDEKLLITFQDSMFYDYQNNIWKGKNLSPKGKVYRKVFTSYKKYFKQN